MSASAAWRALFGGAAAISLASLWLIGGCDGTTPRPPSDPQSDALGRLRAFEEGERAATDFGVLPVWDALRGAEPHALARAGDRAVGVLRGADALLLVDSEGKEIDRVTTPRSPVGVAVAGADVLVACELSSVIARFRIEGDRLQPAASIDLAADGDRALSLRDVALGPEGLLYAVDELSDRLFFRSLNEPGLAMDQKLCEGPIAVERVEGHLLVDCLIDHTVVVRRVDESGAPLAEEETRITHDGPIWSMAARPEGKGLLLVVGGVEDHPLDRTVGFFGYIDSFVFAYRIEAGKAQRIAEINVASHGVVTPKALAFLDANRLLVTGYGGERAIELSLDERRFEVRSERRLPPGSSDLLVFEGDQLLVANPLLDAWVVSAGDRLSVAPLPGPEPAQHRDEIRLGEALFFTTLMAPDNPSDGAHSRFSCETCHFEGYVDGRTHHTGRGDIRATTKPLVGLFNNRPHFTRALDRDLTVVAHAEFRVAGQGSGNDPWFTLDASSRPWLAPLTGGEARIGPEALRKALMRFLMSFTHRPNPAAMGRRRFDERERSGARLFAERCASCHQARLSADEPASAQPFERWEAMVLSERGPIVWASQGYHKTGVEPYVHPDGARTLSLRRLHKKRPYFTNGSARTLDEVLSRARFDDSRFWHDRAPARARGLEPDERQALLAFLRLL